MPRKIQTDQKTTAYCLVIRDTKSGRESVWYEGMAHTKKEATRVAERDVSPGHWDTMVNGGHWRVEKVTIAWKSKQVKQ